MLDMTGAEIRIPQKPSEVFLKAIQALAIADPEMPGTEFKEYAEAWRQICHLEELYAAAERKIRWENLLAEWTPKAGEDKKGPGDPSPSAQDDSTPHPSAAPTPSPQGEGLTYDCASAPMPDPAPEAVEKCAEEGVKADPGAKCTGYMSRLKNETRERLLRLRKEKGLTVNDILAADTYGLRWADVMDMIEAKPVPLPRWEALAKILDQYEEADSGGG